MSIAWRLFVIAVLGLVLWPEFPRYRAEWHLSEANAHLDRALRASPAARDGEPLRQAGLALVKAEQAIAALPADPRAVLAQSIALIMTGRGADAATRLQAAIAAGERPEFTINLGRARTTLGDEAGANAAYLRTAWASPQAIATLPKALREDFAQQVARLDAQLRAGTLAAVPPLDAPKAPDTTK